MISKNSAFKEAPPTKNPSISGFEIKFGAVGAVTEPPYKILTLEATSALTLVFNQSLMKAWTS